MSIDFLIEMGWKSALISGVALGAATLLRIRPADERAAVLRGAILLILALPLFPLLFPALTIVAFAAPEPVEPLTGLAAAGLPAAAVLSGSPAAQPGMLDDPTPLIALLWAGGVAMALVRLFAGLWTLRAWTRSASEVSRPEWREALARAEAAAGCTRPVRLLVSDASSPLSWGWLRPVVLLDRDTVRHEDQADAVLAHEIAHIVRRDWLVLILARVAVAFFWFNPLVWLVERKLVEEAEEAADGRALEHVEPARYAQTLLSCADGSRRVSVPASAIADEGSLGRRVRAILGRKLSAGASDPRKARVAMAACILAAAPIAALKPVAAEAPPTPPAAPAAPVAPAAVAPVAPLAPPPSADQAEPVAPPAGLAAPPAPAPVAAAPPPPASPLTLALADANRDGLRSGRHLTAEERDELRKSIAEAAAEAKEAAEEAREAAEEAVRDSAEARAEAVRQVALARVVVRNAAITRQEAQRIAVEARREARRGIREGASGMFEGARGMDEGARGMDEEARRLGSASYRARRIAEEAERGRQVTDQELLAMIPKLREGAERLRQGAVKMRRSAERMRSQSTD